MVPLRRIKITELNEHLICVLCSGYYVEATTIIECLHTFCKTCIVRYLQTSSFCPVCEVQVHKTKPLLSLREDKTLQDVVYKLVPGLYHDEMARRTQFYKEHPEAGGDRTEQALKERRHFFHVDDQISLSLEFLPPAHAHAHALGLRPLRGPSVFLFQSPKGRLEGGAKENGGGSNNSDAEDDDENKLQFPHRRYLMCPAAVDIRLLEKFIRLKYGLTPHHRIDIVHGGDCLSPELYLLDVVYMYKWTEDGPLNLQYTVISPPIPMRKRPRSASKKSLPTRKETLEPSPKKLKIEVPPKEKDEATVANEKEVEPKPEKEEEEEDDLKPETPNHLSNSLDSSRDDADDAMVIDESASEVTPGVNGLEESSSQRDSPPVVSSYVSLSSQSHELSAPNPKYTLATSYESSRKSVTSSIESLKDFVNSSPSYPGFSPPSSTLPKISKPTDGNSASPLSSITNTTLSEEVSNKTALEGKDKAKESGNSEPSTPVLEKENDTPKPPLPISATPIQSQNPDKTMVVTAASSNLNTISTSASLESSVMTPKLTKPPMVPPNTVLNSTISSQPPDSSSSAVDPKVTKAVLKDKLIPEKSRDGAKVHPLGNVPFPKPSNSFTPSFPSSPSYSNLTNKSLRFQGPHLPPEAYRSPSLSTLAGMKNGPLSARHIDSKPRLGRPPNRFRVLASHMTPRMMPSPSMRNVIPPRNSGPRTGIYSQQRKPPVADKTSDLVKQTSVIRPSTKPLMNSPKVTQNSLPPSLMTTLMSHNQVNQPINRNAAHPVQNITNVTTNITNHTDTSAQSPLMSNPMFANINGIVNNTDVKKIAPKDKLDGVMSTAGLPTTTAILNGSAPIATSVSATQSVPAQVLPNPRPSNQSLNKGSTKSPGRTKTHSNSASILSIAQNLANKQLQQKSQGLSNGLASTQSSTTTTTTSTQSMLGGSGAVTSMVSPIPGAVENPLATQFQAGLCMPPINPALAAAAYGNYQALQTIFMRELINSPTMQDAQRKSESSPIDLSPTNKTPPTSVSAVNSLNKAVKTSPSSAQKFVPISPKNTLNSKSTPVPLKIPNPPGKISTMRNNATVSSKNSVVSVASAAKTNCSSASTASRCTPVTSFATLRNTSSPISASAPSPQSLRSPGLTSVPSPKPAQSPSPTSPSTPATPTISPPTPEVTITKLPNASTTVTTQASSAHSTSTIAPVVTTCSTGKAPNTNTVSITKRPSSSSAATSSKFGVTRSPSNASVRHIPNPSFLSHQSEVKNHIHAKVPVRNTTA